MRTRRWMIIGSLAGLARAGCEEKGPARKMGERIDKAAGELTKKTG